MTVQRDVIVKKLAGLSHHGEDGIIPAYNVLMNVLPVSFWNNFEERMLEAVPSERRSEVEEKFASGANNCGYHTGQGIITSKEFKAVVGPMITEGAKDLLRGAFAVLTATGSAKAGIVQVKEGERLVVRAVNYYEADGKSGPKHANMLRGICAAFFDLAYGEAYPDGLGTYTCEQVAGIESGDPFGEFVVTRKS